MDGMAADASAELSSRERNVLRLAIQGHTDYEIAERLLLEPATVRRELSSAVARLAALSLPGDGPRRTKGGEVGLD